LSILARKKKNQLKRCHVLGGRPGHIENLAGSEKKCPDSEKETIQFCFEIFFVRKIKNLPENLGQEYLNI
jgi:hypothetical protein